MQARTDLSRRWSTMASRRRDQPGFNGSATWRLIDRSASLAAIYAEGKKRSARGIVASIGRFRRNFDGQRLQKRDGRAPSDDRPSRFAWKTRRPSPSGARITAALRVQLVGSSCVKKQEVLPLEFESYPRPRATEGRIGKCRGIVEFPPCPLFFVAVQFSFTHVCTKGVMLINGYIMCGEQLMIETRENLKEPTLPGRECFSRVFKIQRWFIVLCDSSREIQRITTIDIE